jgi:hypothetical protein
MAILTPSNLVNYPTGPGSQSAFATGEYRMTAAVGAGPMSGSGTFYYCPYHITDSAPTAATLVTGRLYGMPFPVSRRVTVDTLAVETTIVGASNSVFRAGIYAATSRTNPYPSSLVVDGGEWDGTLSARMFTATINTTLGPDSLYWLAILVGTASPTFRFAAHGAMINCGFPTTAFSSPTTAISATQSYGSLPGTFPGSGSYNNNTQVIIGVHYSA